ncbi:hypothetical protein FRC03_012894 [Tulasnella sp. 419]|nr:hypothetical protein FRC03_012894 [Tulasnella sp. 419]
MLLTTVPSSEKMEPTHYANPPVELLSLIFLSYIQEMENTTELESALVSITLVSRYWRSVAIGCPCLWNRVCFTKGDSPAKVSQRLQRSGSLPLDIVFGPSTRAQMLACLSHSDRLRRLTIEADQQMESFGDTYVVPLDIELDLLAHPLPSLEALALVGMGGSDAMEQLQIKERSLSVEAPLLEKLVIRGFIHDWAHFTVPIGRLTHLEIHEPKHLRTSLLHLTKAVSQMTFLQYLCLDIQAHDTSGPIHPYEFHITLPNLETLKFFRPTCCAEQWQWILYLDAPKLKILELIQISGFDNPHIEELCDAGVFSFEPLSKAHNLLSLEEIRCIPPRHRACWYSLAEFISVIPSVTRLSIDHHLIRPSQELWEMCSRIRGVKDISIRGYEARPEDAEMITLALRLNPGMQIYFNDVEFLGN